MENDILVVEKKGHVTTLILNRPEKRNSLSPELLSRLARELEKLGQDDSDTRALILRGAGDKAFSAGYDIAAIPTSVPPALQNRLKEQNPLEIALQSVLHFPYPVIAMLNGYAFGAGCELAVSCDLRVGAEGILMGMPPARLGLVYNPQGLMRFVRLLGFAKTREMFFTARNYTAQRAKEIGLLDYLVPKGEIEAFTLGLAEEIASNAPLAVRGTKRILGMLSESDNLSPDQMREAERITVASFNSEDLKEAQKAFLEKRKPVFKGR
jgi:enoyl-CoA hydratase